MLNSPARNASDTARPGEDERRCGDDGLRQRVEGLRHPRRAAGRDGEHHLFGLPMLPASSAEYVLTTSCHDAESASLGRAVKSPTAQHVRIGEHDHERADDQRGHERQDRHQDRAARRCRWRVGERNDPAARPPAPRPVRSRRPSRGGTSGVGVVVVMRPPRWPRPRPVRRPPSAGPGARGSSGRARTVPTIAPAVHHGDPVGQRQHLVQLGRDQQHRHALVALPHDPLVDELDRADVERRASAARRSAA